MSKIYKITNALNGKVYIGKTSYNLKKRFEEHCKDSQRRKNEIRPLYRAMNKYGIENFYIELIEECPAELENEREIYWIDFYESYEEGYNATLGGDGKCLYNHFAILQRLREYPYAKEVSKEFGCCADIVQQIAKNNSITLKNSSQENFGKSKEKSILQLTKDNFIVNEFPSVAEAAKWCFENNLCTTLNSGVRSHIAEVANGKRKTAYGFIWKYK